MDKDIKQIIEDRLSIFVRMYDEIRIVDPVKKLTLGCDHETCYSHFGKDTPCENCISIRALQTDQTTLKLIPEGDKMLFMMAVPVLYDGSRYIAELIKNYDISEFGTSIDLGTNTDFSNEIKRLSHELIIDPLTEIYNKRFIQERLPAEIELCKKEDSPLFLIMCDIDHFKDVNDTYGHMDGDEVLKFFSSEIRRYFSHGSNWVARFGGEEFIVVVKNSSIDSISKKLDVLMNTLRQLKCKCEDGNSIGITASFGIAKWCDGMSPDALIAKADEKLYLAKERGRDQFIY